MKLVTVWAVATSNRSTSKEPMFVLNRTTSAWVIGVADNRVAKAMLKIWSKPDLEKCIFDSW